MNLNFDELMNKVEDLHPDLLDYIEDSEIGMQFLKHPLMTEVYHTQMNAMINERYKYKKVEVAKARDDGDWENFVWIHSRPYRLNALMEVPDPSAELIEAVWIDAEFPSVNRDVWLELFEGLPCPALLELPDKLTIYRGTVADDEDGISWTTDKKIAKFFAKRFDTNGVVKTAKISRHDALYYTNGRGEKEVIYNPLEGN